MSVAVATPRGEFVNRERSLRSLLLIILAFSTWAQAGPGQDRTEQSVFGAEDDNWKRAVPIPDDALLAIRTADNAAADEMPASWFLASEIHLDGPTETDIIVKGVGGLRLPHAALFWVFRTRLGRHELILKTGGDALAALNTRRNGYREIRVDSNTARATTLTIYEFDGQRYQARRTKTRPIE
jgi:hypothetical protein